MNNTEALQMKTGTHCVKQRWADCKFYQCSINLKICTQDHAKEAPVLIFMHYSIGKVSHPPVSFSFSQEIKSRRLTSHMEVTIFFKNCAAHLEENMSAIKANFSSLMFYLVQVVNIFFCCLVSLFQLCQNLTSAVLSIC